MAVALFAAAAYGTESADSALAARADRAFDAGEWASAQALYSVLAARPQAPAHHYGRAIVASAQQSDTAVALEMASRALAAAVPLDSLLKSVETESYGLGNGNIYPDILLVMAKGMPYLQRPLLRRLLNLYVYRADAPNTIDCARRLLAGLPDNVRFLTVLAGAQYADGRVDEAIETYVNILVLQPDNIDALLALANHYDAAGDTVAAMEYFRRANRVCPSPYIQARMNTLTSANR